MSDWEKGAAWLADGMGILAVDKFRLERVRLEERNIAMETGDLRLCFMLRTPYQRIVSWLLVGLAGCFGL
jgi:hypothetical protein